MISPELLRRFPFFAGFSESELKSLAMAAHEQSLAPGDKLFSEGEPAEAFYFLVEGEAEILICAGEDCQESVPLASVSAGQLIGWSALIEPHIYTATVRALRPGRALAFRRLEFAPLVADPRLYSLLMQKVAQVVGRRLKDTRVQLLSLSAHPA